MSSRSIKESKVKNQAADQNVLQLKKSDDQITFSSFFLCGLEMKELSINKEELLMIRNELIEDGLLNENDDLFEEIKCPFYKQMVHSVLLNNIQNLRKTPNLAA